MSRRRAAPRTWAAQMRRWSLPGSRIPTRAWAAQSLDKIAPDCAVSFARVGNLLSQLQRLAGLRQSWQSRAISQPCQLCYTGR